MQAYFDTVTDRFGNSLAGATVTVRLFPAGTLAVLYSDPAGSDPLSNPIVTDANGAFQLFAANGQYTLTIVAQGTTATPTRYITLFDSGTEGSGATDFVSFVDGGTYTTPDGITRTINYNTGTLASYTVAFPGTPTNGQVYQLSSQGVITALTLTAAIGTISYPPSALPAGATFKWLYHTPPVMMAAGTSLSWIYQSAQVNWCRLT